VGRNVMIIDEFSIYNWKITILYETTCEDIDFIIETLIGIDCPKNYINRALDNLEECKLNSGLTYSNLNLKSSVIIINKTSSFSQLINTIAHEYYHLICHISTTLKIEDEEELATLNGNLNMRSYKIVKRLKKSRY
jgi:Zn-dependent peptidase ImmA (M78 family)